ncbi:Hint domain-containing protein [Paracoccaceae bacterium GXU_MW_L88]
MPEIKDPFVIATNYFNTDGMTSAQNGLTFVIDPHVTGQTPDPGAFKGYFTHATWYDNNGDDHLEGSDYMEAPAEHFNNDIKIAAVEGSDYKGIADDYVYLTHIDGFENSTLTFSDGTSQKVYVATRTLSTGETYLDFWDGEETEAIQAYMNAHNARITELTLGQHDAILWERIYQPSFDDAFEQPVCFTRGAMIKTADGAAPVETLQAGDLVWTLDHGMQEILWIGHRVLSLDALKARPEWRPIRITANTLYGAQNHGALTVSPQHRILIDSPVAKRMFGSEQVLVPAKALLEHPGVSVDENVETVEYWHILLKNHEILCADDILVESLFLGEEALKSLPGEALGEIDILLPKDAAKGIRIQPARAFIPRGKGVAMIARLIKNRKALVESAGGKPSQLTREPMRSDAHLAC